MACFWTPMSVEVTARPVYPAASLSRPYHSPFCGGNRSLCELGKNRELWAQKVQVPWSVI